MANGGAREGAGRPKLEATKFREALIAIVAKNAKPLADVWFKKAMSGDVRAIETLADRSIGKVTDNINLKAELQVVMDV